jgi:hypothetical protein
MTFYKERLRAWLVVSHFVMLNTCKSPTELQLITSNGVSSRMNLI